MVRSSRQLLASSPLTVIAYFDIRSSLNSWNFKLFGQTSPGFQSCLRKTQPFLFTWTWSTSGRKARLVRSHLQSSFWCYVGTSTSLQSCTWVGTAELHFVTIKKQCLVAFVVAISLLWSDNKLVLLVFSKDWL